MDTNEQLVLHAVKGDFLKSVVVNEGGLDFTISTKEEFSLSSTICQLTAPPKIPLFLL